MYKDKFLAAFAILLVGSCLIQCDRKEKTTEINFEDTITLEKTRETNRNNEINICVGSMITPKEGYAYYKALLDYIGDSLKMKTNFIEKESYAEVNALLEEGKIDVAFVCGGPYIDGHEKFGLELLAAPQINGETVYYSYIIVHKDSNINRFEQLRGKTFVFADPMSNSGKAYPTYLLKEMGETPETFFREYLYSYAHDASIRAVAEGLVDGGAVDSLVWNYMEKQGSPFTKNSRLIKTSPPYGIPPVVARPTLGKDLKKKIRQILLDMHHHERGKDVLEKMSIDKFVRIDDSNYDSIREVKQYLKGK